MCTIVVVWWFVPAALWCCVAATPAHHLHVISASAWCFPCIVLHPPCCNVCSSHRLLYAQQTDLWLNLLRSLLQYSVLPSSPAFNCSSTHLCINALHPVHVHLAVCKMHLSIRGACSLSPCVCACLLALDDSHHLQAIICTPSFASHHRASVY